MLKELQGLLHTKLDELRVQWVAKVQVAPRLEARSSRRCGVVARPPDPATRCPAELATALAEARRRGPRR